MPLYLLNLLALGLTRSCPLLKVDFQDLTLLKRGTSRLEITMGKQRKTWSTDVKEAIVLSVLRGELGVAEAARQHGAKSTFQTAFS